MGIKDFTIIEKKWPGVLKQLITNRLPWHDFHAGSVSAGPESSRR